LIIAFVPVPPFTPPPILGWRWVTDRVPWQVVDRVPWSPYPRTLSIVTGRGGGLQCLNATVHASGLTFNVAAESPVIQVDRTHVLSKGVLITGSHKFPTLACAIQ
jgi:hypothetical protein